MERHASRMEGHAPSWPRLPPAVCAGPDAMERVPPGSGWSATLADGGPRFVVAAILSFPGSYPIYYQHLG